MQVFFAPSAVKQFELLTKIVRLRVAAAIKKLGEDPDMGKQLRGELAEYRSHRVGDWRIVYLVRPPNLEIVRIGHRREVYK